MNIKQIKIWLIKMVDKVSDKIVTNTWISVAFCAPYFLIPFFIIENQFWIKTSAALFFGIGSVWWLWIMHLVRKYIDERPDFPQPEY